MAVYVITGKLGSGKTLASVGRMHDYLKGGRKVATNIDLDLYKLCGKDAKKPTVYRVSDKPSLTDFENIGLGYDGEYQSEEMNGGLFLDECGTWFNSRNWNDKGRQDVIDFIIHARKKRWDIYFLIQDLEVMDKQARLMFAEFVVYCRRSDRFNIPLLSPIWKLITDKPLPMPKVHIGFVTYGDTANSAVVDRWVYRGTQYYDAYNTEQIFDDTNEGVYQYIPPYYTHGRYITAKEEFKNAVKNYKIKSHHFFLTGAFMASMVVNALVTELPGEPKKGFTGCNQAYKDAYGSCDAPPVLKEHQELIAKLNKIKKEGGEVTAQTLLGETVKNVKDEITKLTGHEPNQDKIVITGSVKYTNGFDYLFTKNDIPFHPRDVGYDVRWVNPCKAVLIKDGNQQKIYCDDTSAYTNVTTQEL
jgi:hypothetical protein